LFFATSYLASVAWAMERRTAAAIIAACGLGAIAALVKITTVLPFAGLAGLMALWGRFGGQSKRGGFWGNLGLAAILTAVPMAAGIVWAHHADAVKNRNPMANFILSGSLNGWNFGSLSQRVNYHTWNTIFSRIPTLFSNGNLFWAECIAALILLVFCRRRGKEALVCTAFFLLSPAIFINLQFIHDYYMCANGIFLLAGGGFLLIAAAENKRWQPIAYALCGFAVVAGAMGHRACFRPFQKRDETSMLPLALKIRESTSPDAVNIYSGFDWNPIVPYYSGRRALMLCNKADGSQATTAIQKLRDKKVGVVVIGPDSRWSKDWLERTMRESGVKADRIWLLSKTDTPVLL